MHEKHAHTAAQMPQDEHSPYLRLKHDSSGVIRGSAGQSQPI